MIWPNHSMTRATYLKYNNEPTDLPPLLRLRPSLSSRCPRTFDDDDGEVIVFVLAPRLARQPQPQTTFESHP